MSICTVNGLAHELDAGLETWGQLLTTLERGEGPARIVVAAVRFAGVDQPTFREPEALALKFRLSAPIEVELSTAGELVASAREAVLGCLDAMAESARHTAESFRLHDLSRAHRGLGDFVATFQLLASLTASIKGKETAADQVGLEPPGADCLECLGVSLGALIDFDVNEDWLSVADVLEYDIADLLPQWARIMRDADGEHTRSSGSHVASGPA